MRAKIVGSTNTLNIVRATFKGLTSQVSAFMHSLFRLYTITKPHCVITGDPPEPGRQDWKVLS